MSDATLKERLRTMEVNGEPWFVLTDVCKALDIKNPSDAASRLDEDEKGVAQTDTLGGSQNVRIINESGLYSLLPPPNKPKPGMTRRVTVAPKRKRRA